MSELSNLNIATLCRATSDGQDFFTTYDEVYDSFDSMGLQENLLRGIYAYGMLLSPYSKDL